MRYLRGTHDRVSGKEKKRKDGSTKLRPTSPAYYMCRKRGCGENLSAKAVHQKFAELLDYISVKPANIRAMADEMIAAYEEGTHEQRQVSEQLKKELEAVDRKLKNVEDSYFSEKAMSKDKFEQY